MDDAHVFWINELVANVTGLLFIAVASVVVTFVIYHAVLEWRATRAARRLSVSEADAVHARLDALGRQLDDLGRSLGVRPGAAAESGDPGLRVGHLAAGDPVADPTVVPGHAVAPRRRHPTPV